MVETVVNTRAFDDSMHAELRQARAASTTGIDVETGAVVVLSYDEVERLAHHPSLAGVGLSFFDLMGIPEGALRRWYGGLMFTNEGEAHHRLRRLVARAFTPRAVERHRALAGERTRASLAGLLASGGGDLVDAFAELPIRVICRLLGVPDDEVAQFLVYGDALSPVFGFMDPDQINAASDAIDGLMADVDRMVGERSKQKADDLISALLESEERGDRLTHEELVAMVGNLIVGGHDTTASQISCTLLTLLRHPHVIDQLRSSSVSAPDVVSETIRYEPSIPLIPRTLAEPVDIGGAERPAGSMVFLVSASANRQEDVWGDPDVVRPKRFAEANPPRVLSFGSGAHYCLGAALARMTVEEVVTGYAAAGDRCRPDFDIHDVAWRHVLGRSPAALPVVVCS